MVSDEKIFSKVDEGKRDFLRKLTLTAAYATPLIASFSLDGVRKAANAQGAYTGAGVLGVAFVPGGGAGGFIVSRTAGPVEEPYGTIRITYTKPMETSLNSCKRVTGYECESGDVVCSKVDVIPAAVCPPEVDLSDGWSWPSSTTEEKEVFTKISRFSLELNTAGLGCAPGDRYRALDGELLPAFATELDTSAYCPVEEDPPIVESKIDIITNIW